MNFKFLYALPALFLLAACETAPGGSGSGSGAGGIGADGSYSGGPVTPGSQEDLAANVGDRVFFALDSSELSSEAQSTLDRQAAWLKTNGDVNLTIEGHCDERGTREYNLALGERRANAAKKYLVRQGVAASRLSTISYGKERPAVVGSNEDAWSQNRRAVSVVTR